MARNTVFISYTLLSTLRLYIILHKRPLTSSIITHNNIHRNQPSYNIFEKKSLTQKRFEHQACILWRSSWRTIHNSIKRQKNYIVHSYRNPTIYKKNYIDWLAWRIAYMRTQINRITLHDHIYSYENSYDLYNLSAPYVNF